MNATLPQGMPAATDSPRLTWEIQVARAFLLIALLILPWNGFPNLLGSHLEWGRSATVYPIAIAMLATMIHALRRRSLLLPEGRIWWLLAALLGWAGIATLSNSTGISLAEFKGHHGPYRAFTQTLCLVFAAGTTWTIAAVLSHGRSVSATCMRVTWIALIPIAAWGIIDCFALSGADWARAFLGRIDPWIHARPSTLLNGDRLNGLADEPAWFGLSIVLLLPLAVASLVTTRGFRLMVKIGMLSWILVLCLLSTSRGLYAVLILVLAGMALVPAATIYRHGLSLAFRQWLCILSVVGISVTALAVMPMRIGYHPNGVLNKVPDSYVDGVSRIILESGSERVSGSGATRSTCQLAALRMAWDHPIAGIGLGQYGFAFHSYIRTSERTPEINDYLNPEQPATWPFIHGWHARFAAETGIPGLGLWLALLVIPMSLLILAWSCDGSDPLPLGLAMALGGMCLYGFIVESFRFPEPWLALGAAFAALGTRKSSSQPTLLPVPNGSC